MPDLPGADVDLIKRFGSAKRPEREVTHHRPTAPFVLSDDAVAAVGKLSEALETVEHARGHLYAFHQLSGKADLQLGDAVEKLAAAGFEALAGQIEQVLVGRDVVRDMWTFEIVETYDEQYWSAFRGVESHVRQQVTGGVPHIFEAEMKQREQGA